jgi:pSer/pThr/pTyr-binding forkhead associated (FHA) protein
MTIQAQHHSTPSAEPRSASEGTGGINPRQGVDPNPLALLDHRTRDRSVLPADAGPGRYLEVEHEAEVRLIPLDRPIIHIGRGLIADVRIEDPHVSRRHAIVAQRGDGVRVLDDRSSNGTFVNGRKVGTAYLSDGDVLRVGSVAFRYVEVQGLARAKPLRRIPLPVRARGPMSKASAA